MSGIHTEYHDPYIPPVINPNQWILNGRSQKWMAKHASRFGYKRYISLFDPTPFKLNTIFRAWFPGDYYVTSGSNNWPFFKFFKKNLHTELNSVNDRNNMDNYTSYINGSQLMDRLFAENDQCYNLLKVYNVFTMSGVSVSIKLVRPKIQVGIEFEAPCNFVLCCFWGKNDKNQIPQPDDLRKQTLFELLNDKDDSVKFSPYSLLQHNSYKYFKTDFNSMGWGDNTYNSVNNLDNLPILLL